MSDVDRCLNTGNPVGTDTLPAGFLCFCPVCRLTRERAEALSEVERLRLGWNQAWQDRGTAYEQSSRNQKRAEQAERERDELAREIARFHATGYVSRADADRLAQEIARLNTALRWANDMLSPENRATLQRILGG